MDKKQLIDHLMMIFKETGKEPTTLNLRWYKGKPTYQSYVKYFGSWENALNELRKRIIKNEIHRK